MFQTKDVRNIKTHILYSRFFPLKIVPFIEIMWKNMVQPDRPHMVI